MRPSSIPGKREKEEERRGAGERKEKKGREEGKKGRRKERREGGRKEERKERHNLGSVGVGNTNPDIQF
jgi:RNA-splicing ligase RtcB